MERSLRNFPLLVPALPWALGIGAVLCLVGCCLVRTWQRRALTGTAALGLAVAATAAWLNLYFAYLPTIDALLGRVARDQVSASAVLADHRTTPAADPSRARGAVTSVAIPGDVSGFGARHAVIYLPPAWFATPRPSLPVLLLLHGTPGDAADWTRAGAADVVADSWATAHRGLGPIMVMPDINGGFFNDTECMNGPGGNAETYLTVDVPAWVTAHLHPRAGRWVVAGASEGGSCALQLALRHADLFRAFADFSGLDRPTFDFGASPPPASTVRRYRAAGLLSRPPTQALSAWFEAGTADRTLADVRNMATAAASHGIPTTFVVRPGGHHTWRLWHRSLMDSFDWLNQQLETIPGLQAPAGASQVTASHAAPSSRPKGDGNDVATPGPAATGTAPGQPGTHPPTRRERWWPRWRRWPEPEPDRRDRPTGQSEGHRWIIPWTTAGDRS